MSDLEHNKRLVRRLVEEVVNARDESVLDELATGPIARDARRWIGPFRRSFPDFSMEIVSLVAEGDRVAAHFHCSGTHLGPWMGHAPTGRSFTDIDELYLFRVREGRLTAALGLEDTPRRLRQLGLDDGRPAPVS